MSQQTETQFENDEELLSSLALPGKMDISAGVPREWMRQGEFVRVYNGTNRKGTVSADAVENYDLKRFDEVHITHPEFSHEGRMNSPQIGDDRFYIIFTDEGALGREGAKLRENGLTNLQFSGGGHMRQLNLDVPTHFEIVGYASEGRSQDTDANRVILRMKLVRSGTDGMKLEA